MWTALKKKVFNLNITNNMQMCKLKTKIKVIIWWQFKIQTTEIQISGNASEEELWLIQWFHFGLIQYVKLLATNKVLINI